MIEEILDLLKRLPILRDCRVWQRDEAPSGAFAFKARCRVEARFTFQIWIRRSSRGLRYAYQLVSGAESVLRWDNAPHFPNMKNFPHHFHDGKGKPSSSALIGDPLRDLESVLSEIEKYLET
ncbi:MAG: DUF6516 family protein [Chloroflexota bacterium]